MDYKVALVTGAARGLGRAIGEALLQRGLKVRGGRRQERGWVGGEGVPLTK